MCPRIGFGTHRYKTMTSHSVLESLALLAAASRDQHGKGFRYKILKLHIFNPWLQKKAEVNSFDPKLSERVQLLINVSMWQGTIEIRTGDKKQEQQKLTGVPHVTRHKDGAKKKKDIFHRDMSCSRKGRRSSAHCYGAKFLVLFRHERPTIGTHWRVFYLFGLLRELFSGSEKYWF